MGSADLVAHGSVPGAWVRMARAVVASEDPPRPVLRRIAWAARRVTLARCDPRRERLACWPGWVISRAVVACAVPVGAVAGAGLALVGAWDVPGVGPAAAVRVLLVFGLSAALAGAYRPPGRSEGWVSGELLLRAGLALAVVAVLIPGTWLAGRWGAHLFLVAGGTGVLVGLPLCSAGRSRPGRVAAVAGAVAVVALTAALTAAALLETEALRERQDALVRLRGTAPLLWDLRTVPGVSRPALTGLWAAPLVAAVGLGWLSGRAASSGRRVLSMLSAAVGVALVAVGAWWAVEPATAAARWSAAVGCALVVLWSRTPPAAEVLGRLTPSAPRIVRSGRAAVWRLLVGLNRGAAPGDGAGWHRAGHPVGGILDRMALTQLPAPEVHLAYAAGLAGASPWPPPTAGVLPSPADRTAGAAEDGGAAHPDGDHPAPRHASPTPFHRSARERRTAAARVATAEALAEFARTVLRAASIVEGLDAGRGSCPEPDRGVSGSPAPGGGSGPSPQPDQGASPSPVEGLRAFVEHLAVCATGRCAGTRRRPWVLTLPPAPEPDSPLWLAALDRHGGPGPAGAGDPSEGPAPGLPATGWRHVRLEPVPDDVAVSHRQLFRQLYWEMVGAASRFDRCSRHLEELESAEAQS